MKTLSKTKQGLMRPTALLTASAIMLPTLVAGCGGGGGAGGGQTTTSQYPPGMGSTTSAQPRQGMTGKQKVMILAGAAALYYLYNKRKNASAGQVQYYRSEKSGRIYYRPDPKNPNKVIYVTPPRQPIQVPMSEAEARQYQGYAGYNNQPSGQNYGGYGYNPNGSYQGGVPAEMM